MKAKFIADWRQATKLEFNAFRCSAACDHAFKEMTIHPTFKVVVMVPVQSESPTKSVKWSFILHILPALVVLDNQKAMQFALLLLVFRCR